MEQYYLVLLAFLGVIAVIDLFVGVSNDAVNFLNSALGCRISSFRTTLWVASIGVLAGATFSSGMMEIARSGVFHPQLFTFSELMIVFFAVMVADVILLDAFNSLGLPTSTTVSIVFELMGAAFAAALFKLIDAGAPLSDVADYINSSKSLGIVSGILISVVVAFISGAVVQYLARLVFTFKFEKAYRRIGAIYGGIALTAIIYFLVMKGAKGASFMRPEWIQWINANTAVILFSLFTGLTVLFQVLITVFRVNIFKIIILAGTFSLAFAFAGNDLVNFVGVPLAAWDSWKEWQASGAADNAFMMGGLLKPSTAPTAFLLLSGFVMVLTLWFSKKAHRVIQTSINLSSSRSGTQEQFGASAPGRMIVRGAMGLGKVISQIIPMPMQRGIASRFEPLPVVKGEIPLPFDYVRASINLIVSAILIASATSLKLPLSTTYVTFMVAMGSSFADGAWDRESAVYRISGVLTVISGWFMTAFTAFTACGLICMLFISWGEPLQLIMMVLALIVVIRTNFFVKEEDETPDHERIDRGDKASIRDLLTESVNDNLNATLTLYAQGLQAFLDEDDQKLRELKGDAAQLFDFITMRRGEYYNMALEGGGSRSDRDARNFYYRAFTSMKEVSHSLRDQIGVAQNYVANSHSPFTGRMRDNIKTLSKRLIMIRDNFVPANCTQALELIDEAQRDFMTQIGEEKISLRKSELYLGYLLFAREVLNRYMMVKLLQSELEAGLAAQQQQQAAFAVEDDKDEPLQPSER